MKTILFTLALFMIVLSKTSSQADRRTALVIGNSTYKNAPLKNPVNDANDIGGALKSLSFSVNIKRNATLSQMFKAIRKFGETLKKGGVGLFFYSGHGMQIEGRNYLIPVDSDIQSEDEVRYNAIDVGSVLDKMESAGNLMNIVFLDACRNNPFPRSFRSTSNGLAQVSAPSGSLIIYATAPGKIASDGGRERNGVYTKCLLKHIRTPELEVGRMLRKVRKDVKKETNQKQIPWESSSLEEDFYFVKSKPPPFSKKSKTFDQKANKSIVKFKMQARLFSKRKIVKNIKNIKNNQPLSLGITWHITRVPDKTFEFISIEGKGILKYQKHYKKIASKGVKKFFLPIIFTGSKQGSFVLNVKLKIGKIEQTEQLHFHIQQPPREFYTHTKKEPFSFEILQKKDKKNKWQRAKILRSNWIYKIDLQIFRKTYLYIVQKGSTGNLFVIFPKYSKNKRGPLKPGKYTVPSEEYILRLDYTPGEEGFYFIYSRFKVSNPSRMLKNYLSGKRRYSNIVYKKMVHK